MEGLIEGVVVHETGSKAREDNWTQRYAKNDHLHQKEKKK